MNIDDLTTTIQGIKDAKENLRGAIIAKGGTLADDAKLSEFKEAVEGLPSGGGGVSETSVDFGTSYSTNEDTLCGTLKCNLAFTKKVEDMIEEAEDADAFAKALISGTTLVPFEGEDLVYKDNIAFLPSNMPLQTNYNNYVSLLEFRGNAYGGFQNCKNLQYFTGDISEVGDLKYMFKGCYKLETITISNDIATSAHNAFDGCLLLTEAYISLPSVKTAPQMFLNCTKLNKLVIDLRSLTQTYFILQSSTNLQHFEADLSSLTKADNLCQAMSKVTTFKIKGMKTSISASSIKDITKDSLIYIFDNCQQVDTSYTLTLHAQAKANHEQWLLNDSNYSASYTNANAKGLTIA